MRFEWPPLKVFAVYSVDQTIAAARGPFRTELVFARWFTPFTGGRVIVNIFRRGEDNPGRLHGHKGDFYTMPLRSYMEIVFEGERNGRSDEELMPLVKANEVTAWHPHYRNKDIYLHNVQGREDNRGFMTITWQREDPREYDFWNRLESDSAKQIWPRIG